MTLDEFLQYAQQRKPFEEPEMLRLMNEMSDEARRITCRLNAEYHTPDEIRALLSELFGRRVDSSLRSSALLHRLRKEHPSGPGGLHQRLLPLPGPRRGDDR